MAMGLREVAANRLVVIYVVVLTLGFGQLFALISTIQPTYDVTFGRAASFPFWFMASAGIAATGTMVNAALVMRVGMRRLALLAYLLQTLFAAAYALILWLDLLPHAAGFPLFFVWSTLVFFMNGLTFGNLNALALQPLGHIAGLAASLVAAFSTVGSAAISLPISLNFDGTPVPLVVGACICSALAWHLMRRTTEG